MTSTPMKVYVCTTCRPKPAVDGDEEYRPGRHMYERLRARLADAGLTGRVQLEPVECLSVCKRPATIALTTPTHWTYIYGDLDPDSDLDDIVAGLRAYAETDDGIVPWAERVSIFKSGVVARIPPSEPKANSQDTGDANNILTSPSNKPPKKQSEIA